MGFKIDWKSIWTKFWEGIKPALVTFMDAVWQVIKALLIGAIGGGIVAYTSGCSSMSTTPRGQTTEIMAIGIPAVAWITHSTLDANHSDSRDDVEVHQANEQRAK